MTQCGAISIYQITKEKYMSTDLPIDLVDHFPKPNEVKLPEKIIPLGDFSKKESPALSKSSKEKEEEDENEKKDENGKLPKDPFKKKGNIADFSA
jgi:hypothetical protein